MSESLPTDLKPMVAFLKVDESGPHLEGERCSKCGVVFVGERPKIGGVEVCGACGAKGPVETIRLADTGKLYNWTIVQRSFPGVKTPFISAIVDLDGGGSLRGNLVGVEPSPDVIKFDMPVKVVYGDAGRQDKDGASYLAYFFAPA
jgi:hypothetical protein